jgi:hypothetical protein
MNIPIKNKIKKLVLHKILIFFKKTIYNVKQIRETLAKNASILCIKLFLIGLDQNSIDKIILIINKLAKIYS